MLINQKRLRNLNTTYMKKSMKKTIRMCENGMKNVIKRA